MSAANSTTNVSVHDSYLELIHRFPLRRIRNDEELNIAVTVVDSLIDKEGESRLDEGQEEYLFVLGDLIHRYESAENPIRFSSDADVLRHLMDSNGLKQRELADNVGITESVISEILSGKRSLNRKQVALVSKRFCVTPNLFFS